METISKSELKAGVDLARVRAAVGPVLSTHGVELVELEWLTERAGWILRLTIEKPGASDASGGVTLEDCSDVSKDVSSVLDVEELIHHHYNLEVSSPGLDRPVRTAAEFARFKGKLAKVKLSKPAPDGQKVLRGELDEAPEGRVAVLVDGKRVEVDLADVSEANLVFELTPQPKKGGGGGKSAKASAKASAKTKQSSAAPGSKASKPAGKPARS